MAQLVDSYAVGTAADGFIAKSEQGFFGRESAVCGNQQRAGLCAFRTAKQQPFCHMLGIDADGDGLTERRAR